MHHALAFRWMASFQCIWPADGRPGWSARARSTPTSQICGPSRISPGPRSGARDPPRRAPRTRTADLACMRRQRAQPGRRARATPPGDGGRRLGVGRARAGQIWCAAVRVADLGPEFAKIGKSLAVSTPTNLIDDRPRLVELGRCRPQGKGGLPRSGSDPSDPPGEGNPKARTPTQIPTSLHPPKTPSSPAASAGASAAPIEAAGFSEPGWRTTIGHGAERLKSRRAARKRKHTTPHDHEQSMHTRTTHTTRTASSTVAMGLLREHFVGTGSHKHDFGPDLAELEANGFGRFRADVGQFLATFGRIWPIWGRMNSTTFGRIWPNSAQLCRSSSDSADVWSGVSGG